MSSGGLVEAHRLVGGANLYPQPRQLRQAQESSTLHNIPANEIDFQCNLGKFFITPELID